MKRLALVALILLLPSMICGQGEERWRMAFWNVENFFDTWKDTLKDDGSFTPEGDHHWVPRKYQKKKNNIYKTIAAMRWPVVVGLAEVENDYVLYDLCRNSPLRKMGYDFIHYESPDERGVDCALLYRADRFEVFMTGIVQVSDSTQGLYTRDVLLVGGVLRDAKGAGDSCFVLVMHWPSKLGGAEAEGHRMAIARRVNETMDHLQRTHPGALVVAMGDLNATSDEAPVSQGLGFGGGLRNALGFYDLVNTLPKGQGSYKYQGQWQYIDHVIANREMPVEVFAPDFLLVDDETYLGRKPFRTYLGMRYVGGFSDHLPILIRVK